MSSRARKLGKRIGQVRQQTGTAKHGCVECRSTEFRSRAARELVTKELTEDPPVLVCPTCSAQWRVKFSGDSAENATVSFTSLVVS
jgi:hypothetical protein